MNEGQEVAASEEPEPEEAEAESETSKHYLTLRLHEFLDEEKYRALLACTIDGRSHFDREHKVNRFKLRPKMIPEAERILGRRLRILTYVGGQVGSGAQTRPKQILEIAPDIERAILLVTDNRGTHEVPFDYVDEVWSILKRFLEARPDVVMTEVAKRLGKYNRVVGIPIYKALYGDRSPYHYHYYWPVHGVLRGLGLVEVTGAGSTLTLHLTQGAVGCKDWKEKLEPITQRV